MMAAIRAAQLHREVILVDKNPVLGKKLLLSGKGRCNLTNFCDLDEFLKRFSGRGEFLRDAFKKLFNRELMLFFERRGLKLKVERQLRVFPSTDSSLSVVKAMEKELKERGVRVILRSALKDVFMRDNRIKGVSLTTGNIAADKLILATGGISFSFTGSTGEGLDLARKLGHKVTALKAGLVPLVTRQGYPELLEGLTLKNIRLNFSDGKRQLRSDIGELLFTADGISGPLVLSLSGRIIDWLSQSGTLHVEIDLKPALSKEQLEGRLLREFKLNPKKTVKSALKALLPLRMVDVFMDLAGISREKKTSQAAQEERRRLVCLLKAFRMDIAGSRPINEAMITRGGISLKDIDPRTMQSRVIKGLYFAGEIIDIDADTGGFNLQAAFSTGYLAGESAAMN